MARGLIDGVARDIVIGPITPERATKKIGIVRHSLRAVSVHEQNSIWPLLPRRFELI